MRFLHTADWHLGRVFHGIHLTEDQAYLLEQFKELVQESKAEAIVISGDIYDRSVPPIEAVNLFDDFLAYLNMDLGIPVIAVAGNHDSPDRLNFANRLLSNQGVHLIGRLSNTVDPIVIRDEFGPVYFCPLPYSEPAVVREKLGVEASDHDTAMKYLTAKAAAAIPQGARSVAVAHAFVAGCEQSESERPLSVGGTGIVTTDCFNSFNYAALGHLHNPQAAGSEKIRYAGSLMKYSFNEAKHQKGINLVDMNEKGAVTTETVSLTPRRDVRCIEGNLIDILSGQVDGGNKDDYLMVTLKDEGALLDPIGKLREVYQHVLHLERTFVNSTNELSGPGKDYKKQGIVDLFGDFFRQITGSELSLDQTKVFTETIEKLEQEKREVKV